MPHRPAVPLVATIVWGLALFPGLFGALLGPMMFDAPGSMRNPVAIFFVLVIVSFPLSCVVAIGASWIAWKVAPDRGVLQWIACCLPLIPVAVVAVNVFIATAAGIAAGPGLHTTIISH